MTFARSGAITALGLIALLMTFDRLAGQDLETIDEQKPIMVSGSVGLSATVYDQTGIGGSRRPFNWLLSGNVSPTIYGIEFPISFSISDQEKSFRQPFNQFGMSPGYGWARAHVGYRSMTFSPYTLTGVTFLGAGLEAAPGNFRLSAMTGRFQRGVELDTTNIENQPAYERRGWGVMIGYADDDGSAFDATLLKARDDTTSIRSRPIAEGVLPQENTVVGGSMRVAVAQGIWIDAAGGASLITRDVSAGPMDVDTSSIPDLFQNLHDLRATTSLAFAWKAGMTANVDVVSLRLGYERIEPGYTSLGAYYFATDLETWTIAPSVDLLDRQLRVSGSIGLQKDNLLKTKSFTTDRVIGSGDIYWMANENFSVNAQFTNYSTGQSAGRVVGNDSILVRDVTRSATIAPRLTMQDENASHSYMISAGYQTYTDLSAFTEGLTNTNAMNATFMYNYTGIESHLSLNGAISYVDASTGTLHGRTIGVSVGGGLPLLNEELSLAANIGYTRAGIGLEGAGGNVFSEGLTAGYRPTEEDAFHMTLSGMQAGGASTTTEASLSLGYTRGF